MEVQDLVVKLISFDAPALPAPLREYLSKCASLKDLQDAFQFSRLHGVLRDTSKPSAEASRALTAQWPDVVRSVLGIALLPASLPLHRQLSHFIGMVLGASPECKAMFMLDLQQKLQGELLQRDTVYRSFFISLMDIWSVRRVITEGDFDQTLLPALAALGSVTAGLNLSQSSPSPAELLLLKTPLNLLGEESVRTKLAALAVHVGAAGTKAAVLPAMLHPLVQTAWNVMQGGKLAWDALFSCCMMLFQLCSVLLQAEEEAGVTGAGAAVGAVSEQSRKQLRSSLHYSLALHICHLCSKPRKEEEEHKEEEQKEEDVAFTPLPAAVAAAAACGFTEERVQKLSEGALCILHRSMATVLDIQATCSPAMAALEAAGQAAGSAAVSAAAPVSLMEEQLLPPVLLMCQHTDSFLRAGACHSLEALLTQACKAVKQGVASTAGGAASPAGPFSPSAMQRILSVILTNWEHSSRKVSDSQPLLFELLLTLAAASSASGKGAVGAAAGAAAASAPSNEQMLGLLQRVLAISPERMHRYAALQRMMTFLSASSILTHCPTLVAEAANAGSWASQGSYSPAASLFLQSFLVAHRIELEQSRGLKPGMLPGVGAAWKQGGLTPAAEEKLEAALKEAGVEHKSAGAAVTAAGAGAAGAGGDASAPASISSYRSSKKDKKAASAAAAKSSEDIRSLLESAAVDAAPLLSQLPSIFCSFSPVEQLQTALHSQCSGDGKLAEAWRAVQRALVATLLGTPLQQTAAGGALLQAFCALVAALVVSGKLPREQSAVALEELLRCSVYSRWLSRFLHPFAASLLNPQRKARSTAAHLLQRDLLTADAGTCKLVVQALQGAGELPAGKLSPATVLESSSDAAVTEVIAGERRWYLGCAAVGDDDSNLQDRQASAAIILAKALRLSGLPALESEGPSALLPQQALLAAVMSADWDVRTLALETACSTSSAYQPPSAMELQAVDLFLRSSVKMAFPEMRKRAVKTLGLLVQRIAGCYAAAGTGAGVGAAGGAAAASANSRVVLLSSASSSSAAPSLSPVKLQDDSLVTKWGVTEELLAEVEATVRSWVCLCVTSCYPGAPADRVALPLELLDLLTASIPLQPLAEGEGEEGSTATPVSVAAAATAEGGAGTAAPVHSALPPLSRLSNSLRQLQSKQGVETLLNLLISPYEKNRRSAAAVLRRFPAEQPLPFYSSPAQIESLLTFAKVLSTSTRDQETEGAASIFRFIYSRFAAGLQWTIQLEPTVAVLSIPTVSSSPSASSSPQALHSSASARFFLQQLLKFCSVRMELYREGIQDRFGHSHPAFSLGELEPQTDAASASDGKGSGSKTVDALDAVAQPLAHGSILALKAVLSELPLKMLTHAKEEEKTGAAAGSQQHDLQQLSLLVRKAFQASLHMVSLAQLLVAGSSGAVQDTDGLSSSSSSNGAADADGEGAEGAAAGGEGGEGGEEPDIMQMLQKQGSSSSSSSSNGKKGKADASSDSIPDAEDDGGGLTKGRVDCVRKLAIMPVSNSVHKLTAAAISGSATSAGISAGSSASATGAGAVPTDIHSSTRDMRPDAPINGRGGASGIAASDGSNSSPAAHQEGSSTVAEMLAALQAAVQEPAQPTLRTAADVLTSSAASAGKGEEGEEDEEDVAYALIVGAWMATREATALIGFILSQARLPSKPAEGLTAAAGGAAAESSCSVTSSSSDSLFSVSEVSSTGTMMLTSLLRLKHVGCINTVSQAFAQVVARLVAGQRSLHPELAQLPVQWLELLLQRTREATQFILRRSAGFSQAFLGIMRNQVNTSNGDPQKRALHRAVLELFSIAGASQEAMAALQQQQISEEEETGEGSSSAAADAASGSSSSSSSAPPSPSSWRAQVHALNILRLLFKDGTVAEVISGYVPVALTCAIEGFLSKSWAVRNSSTMLFAASMDRAVGPHNRNPDEGDRSTTSSAVFFSQYPTLQGFLLKQLQQCAEEAHKQGQLIMHPCLFPIQLLLSRLSPPAAAGTAGGAGEEHAAATTAFAELLLQFADQRHSSVRRMTGRALAAILTPAQALQYAVKAAEQLQKAAGGAARSNNALHGYLCVLQFLLLSISRELDRVILDSTASIDPLRGMLLHAKGASAGRATVSGEAALLDVTAVQKLLTALLPVAVPLAGSSALSSSSSDAGQQLAGHVRATAAEVLLLAHQCFARVRVAAGEAEQGTISAMPASLLLSSAASAVSAYDTAAEGDESSSSISSSPGASLHAQASAALLIRLCSESLLCGSTSLPAPLAILLIDGALSNGMRDVRISAARELKRCAKKPFTVVAAAQGWSDSFPQAVSADRARLAGVRYAGAAAVAFPLIEVILCRLQQETDSEALTYLAKTLNLLLGAALEGHAGSAPTRAALSALLQQESSWMAFLQAWSTCNDSDGQAHILECMAFCCSTQGSSASSKSSSSNSRRLPIFLQLVHKASLDLAAYRLRMASIAAVHRSNLLLLALKQAGEEAGAEGERVGGPLLLQCWSIVQRLLQCFDDEVRDSARRAVLHAVRAALTTIPLLADKLGAISCTAFSQEATSALQCTVLPSALPTMTSKQLQRALAEVAGGAGGGNLTGSESLALQLGYCLLASLGNRAFLQELLLQSLASQVPHLGKPLTAVVQLPVAAAAAVAAGAASSSPSPLASSLLVQEPLRRRPLFVPDKDNDFEEPLYAGTMLLQCMRVVEQQQKQQKKEGDGESTAAAGLGEGKEERSREGSAATFISARSSWVGGQQLNPARFAAKALLASAQQWK